MTMLLFCFSFLDSTNDIVGWQAAAPKGRLTTMFAPRANLSSCRSEAAAGVLIQGVVASTRKRWFESRYLQANGEHIGATILRPNTKDLDFQGFLRFFGVKSNPLPSLHLFVNRMDLNLQL